MTALLQISRAGSLDRSLRSRSRCTVHGSRRLTFAPWLVVVRERGALSLMWHTMMRVGGVHALDVKDYDAGDQFIEVRHRPETGTPIKNKGDGERLVALSGRLCDPLDDWIGDKRPDVTDDHGRHPLVASLSGRACKSTFRGYVYAWTRPCAYGVDCPHDRDLDTCEAAKYHIASKCPSSVSPHATRRGSLTYDLNNEMRNKVVSDRANVRPQVIKQHYDRWTEREKMEQRRDFLEIL